jgi:hypothetical protein
MLPVLRRNRTDRQALRLARMLSELDGAGSVRRARKQAGRSGARVSLARV